MTIKDLKILKSDILLDARGTAYPGSLIAAKRAIENIETGQVLEILTTNERTKNEFPDWCHKMNFEYTGFITDKGIYHLFLKK
jgi:TusA-related sulfurtransferase